MPRAAVADGRLPAASDVRMHLFQLDPASKGTTT